MKVTFDGSFGVKKIVSNDFFDECFRTELF